MSAGSDSTGSAVAVVGAACRLPGDLASLDQLWRALSQGRDLVGELPEERFDPVRFVDPVLPRPGRSYTSAGGYLSDVASFDADYFGISPREAAQMDPQQRLLLELAVEALDDAGITAESLAGSDTAVHVGVADASYGGLQMLSPRRVDAYTMGGAALSVVANRVSHCLDLRGPSWAVDTACSSSLTAVHQACRTLVEGTSRVALCGGVNVLLSPFPYVGFSQASMLSRRGRCAAFSAEADGFVRAEGAGLVVLKRLADAEADGDRVHAVILGSGCNSDGHTRGLALPNGQAQRALLESVYQRAGVRPDELSYVEAHGTGTLVGDPIECSALGAALGVHRTRGALPIGSVKSNIGHLEAGSGIAGLLKALLVVRHRRIPATLHAEPLNEHIDFAGLGLAVATEPRPVTESERVVVGVNSFGFGGANAHVVVASAAPPAPVEHPAREIVPVVVSAHTPDALTRAEADLAERLAEAGEEEFYDLAHTSCLRRTRRKHSTAVLASTPAEAARLLTGKETGHPPLPRARGVRAGQREVGFVFDGNGAAWVGMAADLLERDAVFRTAVREADAALAERLGWSVAERLGASTPRDLATTEIAQPLLFVVQVGVVAMLREHGITPSVVLGHSVGEVAAAWTAGALSLEQAARVIAERSRAQGLTAGSGRMVAAALPPEAARELLADYPELELAAVNSPRDVTIAGPEHQLEKLLDELARREVHSTRLDLDYAFHSRAMDPVHDQLRAALAGLEPDATAVPLISTVTGDVVEGGALDADHWWRNIRTPVLFAPAVERAIADGVGVLVEIGPRPVLRGYLRAITAAHPESAFAVVPTLRRDTDGAAAVSQAAAAVIAAGGRVDWGRYFPVPGRVVDLPAYPWQRERHWAGSGDDWVRTSGTGRIDHPLLGERMPAPNPTWDGAVEPVLVPWLADHRLAGRVTMPAAAFAEMALSAGRLACGHEVEIGRLEVTRPLVVPWPDAAAVRTQVSVDPGDGTVIISSTHEDDAQPRPHARGRVRRRVGEAPDGVDVARLRAGMRPWSTGERFYSDTTRYGLDYGPHFQVLTEIWTGDGETLAAYRHTAPPDDFVIHPALLDGALQAGIPLVSALDQGHRYLPVGLGGARVWRRATETGFVHVRDRTRVSGHPCWDITVLDEAGAVTAELTGCRLGRVSWFSGTPRWRLRTELRAQPRLDQPAAPSPLPDSRELLAAAHERITHLRNDQADVLRRLPRLSETVVARVFARAVRAVLPPSTTEFTMADLISAGMRERHTNLVGMLLPLCAAHGLVEQVDGDRWELGENAPDPAEIARRLLHEAPGAVTDALPALSVLWSLPEVLTGARDPMELFAAADEEQLFAQLYDVGCLARFHNLVAQELVRQIVRRWPVERPLRVLEVGAGTGGMTAALLPLLPADRTCYLYTDISPYFLSRAQKRFARYDFVRYRTFDLDQDGTEFAPGAFDLVVASNALHTARDLERALRRVASLLAPGGRLLALETHSAETAAPLFGFLDSFWSQTDRHLRPRSVMLPRDEWPPLLDQCGFTDVAQTGAADAPVRDQCSAILATAPEQATPPSEPRADAPSSATSWVLLTESAEETPLAEHTARLLRAAGHTDVHTVPVAEWTPSADADREGQSKAVVLILAPPPEDSPTALLDRTTDHAALLRRIVRAQRETTAQWALWVVTRPSGVMPAPAAATSPGDAAVWGLARSLGSEYPDLSVRRVALHRAGGPDHDADRLVRELLDPTDEDEIVLAEQGRFVPRETELGGSTVHNGPFALEIRDPGLSYELVWRARPAPVPGEGQVVVEMRAAALNYRDVLQAAGLLPVEAFDFTGHYGSGLEGAGVVTAIGPGVTRLAVGDRVYGLVPGALASHVLAPADSLDHVPESMSLTEAATMPVVVSTVHHSLARLARLAPGETVLVHGGAGGIGLAVLQYARHRGATVIATAGTPTKRTLLTALGVEHVLDSRGLEFAEQVRRITGGRGVDVVVNSLAGPAMAASLELLRPGGRFVELGKRDVLADNNLPLRPFHNNLAFFAVDLSALITQPAEAAQLAAEVAELIRAGVYRPLPHRVYPAGRIAEAFELVQHSRHVGKVVVSFDRGAEPVVVADAAPPPAPRDPEGTYLVTGGLGGFGAATALWLADHGARHLALVSRRGARAPEAPDLLRALAERGVHATPHAADVTDPDAMRRVVAEIDASGHPLRGVVHCAMHMDDAPLLDLTDERVRAVLRPKLGGALVLDRLTRDRDLDLFLLYSSAATTLGNAQQTPYVAGNAFLEALARQRRQRGLPANVIAWGAIGDVGYVARSELVPKIASLGLEAMSAAEALALAGAALAEDEVATTIATLDWARLVAIAPGVRSPRFSLLVSGSADDGGGGVPLAHQLATMPPDQAREVITTAITELVAEVLQTEPDQIDPHRRIDTYGMDSLMSAELLVAARKRFGVDIPPMEVISGGGTVAALAEQVSLRVGLARSELGTPPTTGRDEARTGAPPGHRPPAPAPESDDTSRLEDEKHD